MTIKEARETIREKYINEEDYYREFGKYSKDHSNDMQAALSAALDALDVVDTLDSVMKIISKHSTPIKLHNVTV